MATVLGLSFHFHDSAAALVIDGRVIAAAAEERFCRRKHTNEFPKLSIEYCLEAAGIGSINDLDAVVYYEKPITKLHRIVESLVAAWPLGLVTFGSRLPSYISSKFNLYRSIENMLPGYDGRILFAEHHLSHAASAYYCSPYSEAAILTIDGVGEWETTCIGSGNAQDIRLDRAIHFPHSIGLLYSALTSYLGFQVNDGEWKVMGLAPYGRPTYVDEFRQLVQTCPDGSFQLAMRMFRHHYSSRWTAHDREWEKLFGFPRRKPSDDIIQQHEDLARSGQAVVEEMILGLAREARRSSGSKNLVIAGGVGLNSVANGRIEQEGIFESVWIQPAAGDDGGALGAALLVSQQYFRDPMSPEMTDTYLGPEYSGSEVREFLEAEDVPFTQLASDQLIDRTADLLAEGSVVGWFQGRMEFGPRSLGCRSILADATNPRMKAIVNSKIKYREYFRPFAPSVPLDEVHDYFEVAPGTRLPFMLKVVSVRPEMVGMLPAVTHEDGTGRVQTVTERDSRLYYQLLKAMKRRTGASVLLNTSFNVRGEPIVCSLSDAWNCFMNTELDALVLGDCLITAKPTGDIDVADRYARSDLLELGVRTHGTETLRTTILSEMGPRATSQETTSKVLSFYRELPFNYYSNAVDSAVELSRANRVREYGPLHKYLSTQPRASVLDVGCGAGWFVNSCSYYYQSSVIGMDLNPTVLGQARAVARLMGGSARGEFIHSDVFDYEPGRLFNVVNSLGALHHTADCPAAIRRISKWVEQRGYLHLGLYHLYGRRPFLQHFAKLRERGMSNSELLSEFAALNPEISDKTHMMSWFRDQVLHPHETQHTYSEISSILSELGFTIERTSINNFKSMPSTAQLVAMERKLEAAGRRAIVKEKRYFPGFFVVWARRD